MKRIAAFALCALLLCQSALAELYMDQPPCDDWYKRPLFRLIAFATEQSDCMLLQCGGESMMVDGGTAPFREDLKTAVEQLGVTHFKYLLNTHFHEDHISGLYWLMEYGFSAGQYLHPYNDTFATDISFRHRDTLRAAQRQGVPVRKISHGDTLMLGEALLTILRYDEGTTTNARSVAIRVDFGSCSLLLGADIIGETQNWMLKTISPDVLDVDIVKAPHHGVTPMVGDFLTAASPLAVLFTSTDKRVTTAQNQLDSRGIPYFFSGDGRVVLETDGDDWYVYQLEGAF